MTLGTSNAARASNRPPQANVGFLILQPGLELNIYVHQSTQLIRYRVAISRNGQRCTPQPNVRSHPNILFSSESRTKQNVSR